MLIIAMTRAARLAILVLGIAGALGVAGRALADDLDVVGAWVRLPPPGSNAAAYATFLNPGDHVLRIVNVHAAAAERAELHRSVVEGGVAMMEPVDAIEVPAHGSVSLEPGGLHVMLIGPRALHEGEAVGLVFGLSNGKSVHVAAAVRRAAPHHEASPEPAPGSSPAPETDAAPDHSHHH